jgi:archaellum component FlaC
MSITRTLDHIETHLDYARDYFHTLQNEIDEIITEYDKEFGELKNLVETLEEQNESLEEQVEDLNRKLAIFELENIELRLRIEVYELEV